MRSGKGDSPHKEPTVSPFCRASRMIHQAHGNKMLLAPKMRAHAMSSGNKVCDAEARATTMKDVQMRTVMTADSRPTVWGDKAMCQ